MAHLEGHRPFITLHNKALVWKGEKTDSIIRTVGATLMKETREPSRASNAVCSFICLFALSDLHA